MGYSDLGENLTLFFEEVYVCHKATRAISLSVSASAFFFSLLFFGHGFLHTNLYLHFGHPSEQRYLIL